jgi:hypothetical protein
MKFYQQQGFSWSSIRHSHNALLPLDQLKLDVIIAEISSWIGKNDNDRWKGYKSI